MHLTAAERDHDGKVEREEEKEEKGMRMEEKREGEGTKRAKLQEQEPLAVRILSHDIYSDEERTMFS